MFAALKRERECFFLHRLDRNTSGLLVFALKEGAEKELLAAFKERRIEKRYCALCFGKFGKEEGILTAYLKKDENKSLVRIYDAPTFGAEKIVTEYRAGERCGEFTKTEILLHTGKTHQIRAHLAHIGCPVAGDTKYGDKEKNRKYNLTRQCLIAKSLKFSLLGKLAYLNDLKFVSRFELKIPCLPDLTREALFWD